MKQEEHEAWDNLIDAYMLSNFHKQFEEVFGKEEKDGRVSEKK